MICTARNKTLYDNNQISPQIFCADPTAVEYCGRLYVYGTNDHQQHDEKGADKDNSYELIKSLVIFSTEDMVNWTYHGLIPVGEIAPWIVASWAPSVVSRTEEDGLTHFYLYFSNSGTGVGVLTSTDPLGPWSDPLGRPLIAEGMRGLEGIPHPFDPGVLIDPNGDGWLTFGGGRMPEGTAYRPGVARIVKLSQDMLGFESDFVEIPAPYFFEASELNYINGTYVYTYNSDWSNHSDRWEYHCPPPSICSMVYMISSNPLDPQSWEMRGEYFKNPGQSGFEDCNNHTHLHKYRGKWYIFSHNLMLKGYLGIRGGYRSICVNEIEVDEVTLTIVPTGISQKGIPQGFGLSPYVQHLGSEYNNTAGISYDLSDEGHPLAASVQSGAWVYVRDVCFDDKEEPLIFSGKLHGRGTVEVRLDQPDGNVLASLSVNGEEPAVMCTHTIVDVRGMHDLFFIFSGDGMAVEHWQFSKN